MENYLFRTEEIHFKITEEVEEALENVEKFVGQRERVDFGVANAHQVFL